MAMTQPDAPTGSPGIGVMFLAFFGTWWLALGCRGLFGGGLLELLPALAIGAVVFIAGQIIHRHQGTHTQTPTLAQDREQQAARRRMFHIVNIAQWAAIVAWIIALNLAARTEWILPGIMFIVGLHFFPLARLFNNGFHIVTGAALTLLAASYPFVTEQGPTSPYGPFGAGLILLAAAVTSLIQYARRHAR